MDNYRVDPAMTTIALLVESGATPSSVTLTLDLFRIAARLAPDSGFRLQLFSAQGGNVALDEALQISTHPLPPRLDDFDAVILPGFFAEDLADLLLRLEAFWQPTIARLRTLPRETLVATSCYGTFVLAESGLLAGRSATTTWWLEDAFAARYPQIRLDAAKALVDDGRLLTAGAMTAHAELSLHVLRRLHGHALARQVGSLMLVDEAKSSQRPFMALQRHFADPLVQRAVEAMELAMDRERPATELAAQLHVSYRTLHRRFHSVTGMAPLSYFQALRVERAKELLECTTWSVEQVAAAVGYGDVSAFRRIFARLTALSPAQYRRQFRGAGG